MGHLGMQRNCQWLGRAEGEEATRPSNVSPPTLAPSTWPAPPSHLPPPAEGLRPPPSLGLQMILPPALGRKVGEWAEARAQDQPTWTLRDPHGEAKTTLGHLLQPMIGTLC